MQQTFKTTSNLIKRGGNYVLIVGHNRTTIGGETELINTPELLGDIAINIGWELIEILKLETYKRYGIHSSNAIQGESLLVLKNE
jgi:site-specific DNA-methyltransferase (cytosine-N4-specific)